MKRKRELTRRQRALCRLAIAALVLVVVNYVGTYGLTPGHAIRLAEEAMDCGRTRVVTAVQYRFSEGWEAREPFCIDCTTDAPAHGAVCRLRSEWSEEPEDPADRDDGEKWQHFDEVWYLFGRVDDPKAARVRGRVVLREEEGGEDLEVLAEADSERWEWFQKDGESYFFFPVMTQKGLLSQGRGGYWVFQYQLLDRNGEVLYEDKNLDGVMVYLAR